MKKNFLYSQILIGVPEYHSQKVGKKNKVTILFHSYNVEIPNYEIFKLEDGKRIKVGSNNRTSFDYDFIPKSLDDNNLDLIVTIPFKNQTFDIPVSMTLGLNE